MARRLTALVLVLVVLCGAAAACAETQEARKYDVKITMEITPERQYLNKFLVYYGEKLGIKITVENTSGEDFQGQMELYDPEGKIVEDFPNPVLKAGERVEWSGTRVVTEEKGRNARITYTIRYSCLENEHLKQKTLHFSKDIFVSSRTTPTPMPTPAPTPDPTPVRPEDLPRLIAYSVTKEDADSETVGLCCLDEDGFFWSVKEVELDEPVRQEDVLRLLLERRGMKLSDMLSDWDEDEQEADERIRGLMAMAQVVEKAEGSLESTGQDIGENAVYAVKYDLDGNPEPVLLGVCGDSVFENKDPNAQALYQVMIRKQNFNLPCGFAEEGLTPHGFEVVSAREFFGLEKVDAETAVITGALQDCEAGPIDVELTEEDRNYALAILERGLITGKANPWMVTGGTVCYFFMDEQGECLGAIETYNGLAVGRDGMYTLSLPDSTETLTEEEKQLLHLKIEGDDYELGKSTPRDLIRNGWYCWIENDGSFAFCDDEAIGTFYAYTRGDSVDEPIVAFGNQFAYSIHFEYCGFDGFVDPENPEDMDTIWRMKILEELRDEIREYGFDEEDYNLNIDPFEGDDEDERGYGTYWKAMEKWMLTIGERDEEGMDNGTRVYVNLSDGHVLSLFTASSPVNLTLGHDYGEEED